MDWDKLRIFHAVADAGSLHTREKACVFRNRQSADKFDHLKKVSIPLFSTDMLVDLY